MQRLLWIALAMAVCAEARAMPSARVALGATWFQRDAHMLGHRAAGLPCYCSEGGSNPFILAGSISAEVYAGVLPMVLPPELRGLGLYTKDYLAANVRSYLGSAPYTLTSTVYDIHAGAIWRIPLIPAWEGFTLGPKVGFARFEWPLGYDGDTADQFPSVFYMGPEMGLVAEIPLGAPFIQLVGHFTYAPVAPRTVGREGFIQSGWSINTGAGVRLRLSVFELTAQYRFVRYLTGYNDNSLVLYSDDMLANKEILDDFHVLDVQVGVAF